MTAMALSEICVWEGCDRPTYAVTTGLCRTHHKRDRLGLPMDDPMRGTLRICDAGCGDRAVSDGYCMFHYKQQIKGKPFTNKPAKYLGENSVCSVPQCSRGVTNMRDRLCQRHARNGADHLIKGDRAHWDECAVSHCNLLTNNRMLCNNHRMKASQYGLTAEEYVSLISNFKCVACGSTANPHVHHDHTCCSGRDSCGNCVVAALCGSCNASAGMCKDDPARLRKLADVLELGSWRSRQGSTSMFDVNAKNVSPT